MDTQTKYDVTDSGWVQAYNEHVTHVGGFNYCSVSACPFFVELWDRNEMLDLQDELNVLPWGKR